jgi:hypothetical protein
MTKEVALRVKDRSTRAIEELVSILRDVESECSELDFQTIKRGIGLTVGDIQMELLELVNHEYPELDDLKE